MSERLQKIIAEAGVASRRAAETMIVEGRVSVNGTVVRVLGSQAEPEDDIRVDGERIRVPESKRYLLLHKPPGYVTTLSDPEGRPTVRDLVASAPERLYPVGRLDYDSEGLLVMTNDGDFAYHLQHPRFGVPKSYRVKLAGAMEQADVERLKAGIRLPDGFFRPVDARLEERPRRNSWLLMTITEGRNRIIRRAMEQLGYPVLRLIRVEIGGVPLGSLASGEYRDLTEAERDTLRIYFKKFA